MKTLILGGLAALSLSACVPSDVDTQIANTVPKVCAGLQIADAAFDFLSASAKLSPQLVKAEETAMAGIAAICANPSQVVDIGSAAEAVGRAYTAVIKALDQAKDQAPEEAASLPGA